MKSPRLSFVLIALLLLGGYAFYRSPHFTRAQNTQTPCCGQPDQTAPREIDFPYYSLRDGFNSTLLLVSASPKPMDLVLAVRSLSGQTLLGPPMTIQPQEKLAVDLRNVLTEMSADVNGEFAEGSVSVYFQGTIMPLAGQLTVTNPALSLIHESEMVENDPGHSDLPAVLDGLWWGIGGSRDARIMVSNTAANSLIADVFLDFQGQRHPSAALIFTAHETKVLSITKLLGDLNVSPSAAPEGGITIMPRGPKPTLIAQGKITDPVTGFSTTLNFPLPQVQQASALHASGVPIGTPTQDSPYAGAGTFVPHVILRNLLASPQDVTITIEYQGQEGPEHFVLAPLPVAAYTTEDMSLDSVMGQLPLPSPYASIRIQYSGPPGSAIAEVSSIEEKRDLVIDSRLANEGDGWAGSGAHPWHLDDETESILFLSNMGDKDARIGFHVQANGVHYYLTKLKLSPHETRAVDLRKLRDAQKPDFRKNTIPAKATDGSVLWIRLDDVPVMGRLVVVQRHKGMASNYDCNVCKCPANYTGLSVSPASFALLPGQTMQCACRATYTDCNNNIYTHDETSSASWSSSNTAVATMDSTTKGLVHALAGGTATINASYTGCSYTYDNIEHACTSTCDPLTAPSTCDVVTISGPQTVWCFNGQTPSGYTTTITLTATPSGASSYTWAFTAGSDKATLSGQTANMINLSGKALSASAGDVQVTVTVEGTTSAPYAITVRGPKLLLAGDVVHQADSTYGYASFLHYTINDNLSQTLPSSVALNENWTTTVTNDYSGTNWRRGNPGSSTTSSSALADEIQGEALSLPPVPVPTFQSPLGSTKVQHWGQEWRVGSSTSGLGARVQTDTIQKYTDHAVHQSIVSPAP